MFDIPECIKKDNTVNVDVVTGAPFTSERIASAVALCLEEAANHGVLPPLNSNPIGSQASLGCLF